MLNSNIRCIEMTQFKQLTNRLNTLNSNIRCIEISQRNRQNFSCVRWIVTLDVLKYQSYKQNKRNAQLNSNIRCIEIKCGDFSAWNGVVLNSNIRCIEIQIPRKSAGPALGWIVTLDVLKYNFFNNKIKVIPVE